MNATRRTVLMTFAAMGVTPEGAFAAQRRGDAPAQGPAQAQPDVDAARKELPTVLNALVRFEVARRGGRLLEDAVRAVDAFVQKGVDTLAAKGELVNVFAVSTAIDGARRFGNELVTEANRASQNLKEIGASIVTAASKRLCPMYPFC
jgi:hypothetical protein